MFVGQIPFLVKEKPNVFQSIPQVCWFWLFKSPCFVDHIPIFVGYVHILAPMTSEFQWHPFPRLCHFWQLQMVRHASVAHQETNLAVEGQRQHTTCEQTAFICFYIYIICFMGLVSYGWMISIGSLGNCWTTF